MQHHRLSLRRIEQGGGEVGEDFWVRTIHVERDDPYDAIGRLKIKKSLGAPVGEAIWGTSPTPC